uniref:Uncharacterized protein n=1 Tax=Syphacia muris TaxID=451379 RepID=A0A0N5B1A5_9BILA
MIHVFNCPIDPSTVGEFQQSNTGDAIFVNKNKDQKVTYHKDGRRIIEGKMEQIQSPEQCWSATLNGGVFMDWKRRCDSASTTKPTFENQKTAAAKKNLNLSTQKAEGVSPNLKRLILNTKANNDRSHNK